MELPSKRSRKTPRTEIETKFSYQQICPYLMYWYCDKNTITPKTALFGSNNTEYFDGWGIKSGALKEHGTSSQVIFGDKTQNKEGVFYYEDLNGKVTGNPLSGDYPYVDRSFTLASGPFTGQLGTYKMIDDLAVSWSGKSDKDPRAGNGHVYVFKVNHVALTGKFIGVSQGRETLSVSNTASGRDKITLLASDFYGKGVELEAPVHLKIEGDRTYAAIIQTPPYHVDNIPLPWGTDRTTPQLTNFTYNTDLSSSYTHSSTSETGHDVSFDMKGSIETIEAFDTGSIGVIKTAAAFVIGKLTSSDGIGAVLDALVDKVDTTKTEADKSSISTALTDTVSTSTSDQVLYYSANVHVWRYAIKEPVPSWLFAKLIEGDSTSASGDKFLTFSMADDPVFHTAAGLQDDCYQPLHEKGNLFSYPTNISQIPGYEKRQLELTGQSSITYSPGTYKRTITVTDAAAKITTETRKVHYGIISNVMGYVGT